MPSISPFGPNATCRHRQRGKNDFGLLAKSRTEATSRPGPEVNSRRRSPRIAAVLEADKQKYDPADFALRLLHKDVGLAVGLGREVGVPMRLANEEEFVTEVIGRPLPSARAALGKCAPG